MEEVDLEEAIARLKLCMNMSLHGGEQTIVNIKDLEKVLKVHQELQDEFFWQQVRITNEFIPKSKVKEKIEELEKQRKKYYRKDLSKAQQDKSMKMWGAICYLQELLREE